jgi:hypothetical protein
LGSWRSCEAAFHSNGKIKPNRRIVDEKEEEHPEGAYYLYQRKNWISRVLFVRDELLQFPPPFSHRCSASREACTARFSLLNAGKKFLVSSLHRSGPPSRNLLKGSTCKRSGRFSLR